METLFPIQQKFPDGFIYKENFLTEDEEVELIKGIAALQLHTFLFQGYEAKRKVVSYGYDYNFNSRTISPGEKIPEFLMSVVEKAGTFLKMNPALFAEVLVTEYPEGSVINWHRDAPPFELIVGISLLSDCVFKLRPQETANRGKGTIKSFAVKRRSFYVISGKARTDWQHSIAPVKSKRYSVTLRTLYPIGNGIQNHDQEVVIPLYLQGNRQ